MSGIEICPFETLPVVKIVKPRRFADDRGFFSEVWRDDVWRTAGIDVPFVQENHALSRAAGTVRGLHFQIGKAAQAKLIRCTRGSIFDVAVDIRRGSPTFGRHVAATLSAENWQQLFVPVGFAHGYCTLEPETEVIYKVSAFYDPASERGLAWDDEAIGIDWPIDRAEAILVARDRGYPKLSELEEFFSFVQHID
jgi:dTDP-4-dehydrorhamnose 3,5-epimerase